MASQDPLSFEEKYGEIVRKDEISETDFANNTQLRQAWLEDSKHAYEMQEGKPPPATMSDQEIIDWGISYARSFDGQLLDVSTLNPMGWFDGHFLEGGAIGILGRLRDASDTQKDAFARMTQIYEKYDDNNAVYIASSILRDPTSLIGLSTFGIGTAAMQGAKQAGKLALKEALKSGVSRQIAKEQAKMAARTTVIKNASKLALVGATEGTINAVADDLSKQEANQIMLLQHEFDWNRFGLSVGIGAAAGATFSLGGAGLSKLFSKKVAESSSSHIRDLFDPLSKQIKQLNNKPDSAVHSLNQFVIGTKDLAKGLREGRFTSPSQIKSDIVDAQSNVYKNIARAFRTEIRSLETNLSELKTKSADPAFAAKLSPEELNVVKTKITEAQNRIKELKTGWKELRDGMKPVMADIKAAHAAGVSPSELAKKLEKSAKVAENAQAKIDTALGITRDPATPATPATPPANAATSLATANTLPHAQGVMALVVKGTDAKLSKPAQKGLEEITAKFGDGFLDAAKEGKAAKWLADLKRQIKDGGIPLSADAATTLNSNNLMAIMKEVDTKNAFFNAYMSAVDNTATNGAAFTVPKAALDSLDPADPLRGIIKDTKELLPKPEKVTATSGPATFVEVKLGKLKSGETAENKLIEWRMEDAGRKAWWQNLEPDERAYVTAQVQAGKPFKMATNAPGAPASHAAGTGTGAGTGSTSRFNNAAGDAATTEAPAAGRTRESADADGGKTDAEADASTADDATARADADNAKTADSTENAEAGDGQKTPKQNVTVSYHKNGNNLLPAPKRTWLHHFLQWNPYMVIGRQFPKVDNPAKHLPNMLAFGKYINPFIVATDDILNQHSLTAHTTDLMTKLDSVTSRIGVGSKALTKEQAKTESAKILRDFISANRSTLKALHDDIGPLAEEMRLEARLAELTRNISENKTKRSKADNGKLIDTWLAEYKENTGREFKDYKVRKKLALSGARGMFQLEQRQAEAMLNYLTNIQGTATELLDPNFIAGYTKRMDQAILKENLPLLKQTIVSDVIEFSKNAVDAEMRARPKNRAALESLWWKTPQDNLEDVKALSIKFEHGYYNPHRRRIEIERTAQMENAEAIIMNIEDMDGQNAADAPRLLGYVEQLYQQGNDHEAIEAIRMFNYKSGKKQETVPLLGALTQAANNSANKLKFEGIEDAHYNHFLKVIGEVASVPHSPYTWGQRDILQKYANWSYLFRHARKFPGANMLSTPGRSAFVAQPLIYSWKWTAAHLSGGRLVTVDKDGKKLTDPEIHWLKRDENGDITFGQRVKQGAILVPKSAFRIATLPLYPGYLTTKALAKNHVFRNVTGYSIAGGLTAMALEEGVEEMLPESWHDGWFTDAEGNLIVPEVVPYIGGAHWDIGARVGTNLGLTMLDYALTPIQLGLVPYEMASKRFLGTDSILGTGLHASDLSIDKGFWGYVDPVGWNAYLGDRGWHARRLNLVQSLTTTIQSADDAKIAEILKQATTEFRKDYADPATAKQKLLEMLGRAKEAAEKGSDAEDKNLEALQNAVEKHNSALQAAANQNPGSAAAPAGAAGAAPAATGASGPAGATGGPLGSGGVTPITPIAPIIIPPASGAPTSGAPASGTPPVTPPAATTPPASGTPPVTPPAVTPPAATTPAPNTPPAHAEDPAVARKKTIDANIKIIDDLRAKIEKITPEQADAIIGEADKADLGKIYTKNGMLDMLAATRAQVQINLHGNMKQVLALKEGYDDYQTTISRRENLSNAAGDVGAALNPFEGTEYEHVGNTVSAWFGGIWQGTKDIFNDMSNPRGSLGKLGPAILGYGGAIVASLMTIKPFMETLIAKSGLEKFPVFGGLLSTLLQGGAFILGVLGLGKVGMNWVAQGDGKHAVTPEAAVVKPKPLKVAPTDTQNPLVQKQSYTPAAKAQPHKGGLPEIQPLTGNNPRLEKAVALGKTPEGAKAAMAHLQTLAANGNDVEGLVVLNPNGVYERDREVANSNAANQGRTTNVTLHYEQAGAYAKKNNGFIHASLTHTANDARDYKAETVNHNEIDSKVVAFADHSLRQSRKPLNYTRDLLHAAPDELSRDIA